MRSDSPPVAATSHGLHVPVLAATAAGRANTAPPITWLTPMAVRSHRPSARLSAGRASRAGVRIGSGTGRLYHGRTPVRAGRTVLGVGAHTVPDPDIIIKPRDVMPGGAVTLPAAYYTDPAYF